MSNDNKQPYNTNFVAEPDGELTIIQDDYEIVERNNRWGVTHLPTGEFIGTYHDGRSMEADIRQHMAEQNHANGFTDDSAALRASLDKCLVAMAEFDSTNYDDYDGPHLADGIRKLGRKAVENIHHGIDLAAPFIEGEPWNGFEWHGVIHGEALWKFKKEKSSEVHKNNRWLVAPAWELLINAHRIVNGEIPDPREREPSTSSEALVCGSCDAVLSRDGQPGDKRCGDCGSLYLEAAATSSDNGDTSSDNTPTPADDIRNGYVFSGKNIIPTEEETERTPEWNAAMAERNERGLRLSREIIREYERWEDSKTHPAVNSYARHFADPVKAAEDDFLGQALEALRNIDEDLGCTGEDMRDAKWIARTILDKAKGGER